MPVPIRPMPPRKHAPRLVPAKAHCVDRSRASLEDGDRDSTASFETRSVANGRSCKTLKHRAARETSSTPFGTLISNEDRTTGRSTFAPTTYAQERDEPLRTILPSIFQ